MEEILRTAWCPYELESFPDSHCCLQVNFIKERSGVTKYTVNERSYTLLRVKHSVKDIYARVILMQKTSYSELCKY